MKKWEEIIKERLEEQNDALPEDLFKEFTDRLDARDRGTARTHHPLLWTLGAFAAACLAAVPLIHKPAEPENEIQIVSQPSYPVAAVIDDTDIPEPVQLRLKGPRPILPEHAEPAEPSDPVEIVEFVDSAEPVEPASDGTPDVSAPEVPVSLFVPENPVKHHSTKKVGLLAGSVAGGGTLAAIVSNLIYSGMPMNTEPAYYSDFAFGSNQVGAPGWEYPTGESRHYFPVLIGGLSVGIPVADRLKLTTGVEYSQYKSSFTWKFRDRPYVGEKEQIVRYLGVPLRLDCSLVRNEWLDVYFGLGAKADFCVGATLADARIGVPRTVEKLERDGVSFSLIGAAGSQLNINKRIGVYLEPELIWTGGKPSSQKIRFIPGYDIDGPILPAPEFSGIKTYRSEHPFMFSIATGFRINLGIDR